MLAEDLLASQEGLCSMELVIIIITALKGKCLCRQSTKIPQIKKAIHLHSKPQYI
jgi:hypothetical protein